MPAASSTRAGVVLSLCASVLFGGLFLIPPLLHPLGSFEVVAWRIIATLPVLLVLFACTVGLRDVAVVARRIRRRPALALILVIDAAMLAVQLWIFGWAPISGHGLEVATGYLLLPLTMVALGSVLHGERLTGLRIAAVAAAAIGVVAALVLGGAVGLITAVVAVGYPLYFDIRRRFGLDTAGATLLEQLVLLPAAVALLVVFAARGSLAATPEHIPVIALFGLISGVALWMYLSASSMLPFGLFGLLTYVEPVLLVLVSALALGEPLRASDALVYGPIALALGLLAAETLVRRTPPPTD